MVEAGRIQVNYKITPASMPGIGINESFVSQPNSGIKRRGVSKNGVTMIGMRAFTDFSGNRVRRHIFQCDHCGRTWERRKVAEMCYHENEVYAGGYRYRVV